LIPFERRTTHQQRESTRQELHHLIDGIIDNWEAVQHQALEMGKGFSRDTLGDGRSSGGIGTSRTETLADTRNDPGDQAAQWITDLNTLIKETRSIYGRSCTVLPDHDTAEKMRGRVNTVDKCALCEQPNPKMKRVDGQPYCATSCYYKVWRSGQQTA
jgi:hypothetical protein